MKNALTNKVAWKIQTRGAYKNHVAIIDGIRVVIFRPTLESDFVIALNGDEMPGSYKTVALAKKAL